MADDLSYMQEAISLASNGFPAPNPHVGCVVVRDGEIVGRGWHEYAGGLHAEVVALREAGEKAKGATVYVTLEPCNHQGRTPPCSQALIDCGVAKVVIANLDPNPVAAGGRVALAGQGIEVVTGVLSKEASEVNEQFLFAVRHRRPLLSVKVAMTLDGKIGLPDGSSQWITSEDARRDGQRLRAVCGAVLVGRKTAEFDRARLTVRDFPVLNQPVRIVLDPRSALSLELPIFSSDAPTWHVTDPLEIPELLSEAYRRGIKGILVEGGPYTIAKFLEAGVVDRLVAYVSPNILPSGVSWASGLGAKTLDEKSGFRFASVEKLTNDLRIILEHRNLAEFRASY
jgi:diaminohydroxyphosphoribosylaminopyrimidine deaminase / 5-amino-6-(5-phosphoribosylamino)uracil reductase